ncbi:hypothetical protein T484DRAFT_1776105 [Baffinella frigidus]|nr:hypothetical protein T484DRAFT_1776105 [Cryptophyta sp. CCMP2293]
MIAEAEVDAEAGRELERKLGEAGALRVELERTLTEMGFSGQNGECPVALEKFGPKEPVVVLECFHIVGREAWAGLVKRLNEEGEPLKCPLCRHGVVDPTSVAPRVAAI